MFSIIYAGVGVVSLVIFLIVYGYFKKDSKGVNPPKVIENIQMKIVYVLVGIAIFLTFYYS